MYMRALVSLLFSFMVPELYASIRVHEVFAFFFVLFHDLFTFGADLGLSKKMK